jgi:hypothetical protein
MDESGDKGLKLGQGSTPWLVIGAVLFPSRESADACDDVIKGLRQDLGSKEFHFAKDADERRTAFIETVRGSTFTYYCVACDKSRLNLRRWKKPEHLFNEVAGHLMAMVSPMLADCTLWFDTLGGKTTDREYARFLEKKAGHHGGSPRISRSRSIKSDKENLAQLTDYVCGSIHRSVAQKGNKPQEFRELFQVREGTVLIWPEVEKETD